MGFSVGALASCERFGYNDSIIPKEEKKMDIKGMLKEKVEEIVKKITSDKKIAAKFKADPVSTVEELLGIDLPNDQVEAIVEAVKAKVALDKVDDLLGGLGKLFGK